MGQVAKVHAWISGRVQGVGFRYSAVRRAQELGLSGWVRNLPDGRVELEFEGPRRDLQAMIDWCELGPRLATVQDIQREWSAGEQAYTGIQVRY